MEITASEMHADSIYSHNGIHISRLSRENQLCVTVQYVWWGHTLIASNDCSFAMYTEARYVRAQRFQQPLVEYL